MTTTTGHPTPARVAELRSRHHKATILIFRVSAAHYAAYTAPGSDAGIIEGLVAGMSPAPRSILRQHGAILEFTFGASSLEPLLSAVVANGHHAAVCERARDTGGQHVERVVTATEDGA